MYYCGMNAPGKHVANESAEISCADGCGQQRRPGKPPGHAKPPGSGRRKGTPNKSTAQIRAVAQKHGDKAIRELVRLMTKSDNEQTRLRAAQELLDRGYGRPITPSEISGPNGAPLGDAPHAIESPLATAQRVAFLLSRGVREAKHARRDAAPKIANQQNPEAASTSPPLEAVALPALPPGYDVTSMPGGSTYALKFQGSTLMFTDTERAAHDAARSYENLERKASADASE